MKHCALRFTVSAPMGVRVKNIRDDYSYLFCNTVICVPFAIVTRFLIVSFRSEYEKDNALLRATLAKLVPLHGNALVGTWLEFAERGQWDSLVEDLLSKHYDPAYLKARYVCVCVCLFVCHACMYSLSRFTDSY